MSDFEEFFVTVLRKTLLLHLDDLLAINREIINAKVSRSGLNHCLRRHGVGNLDFFLSQEDGIEKPYKTFKDNEPGFLHVDAKYLPQMSDESRRRYLFVAIDRATHWVYLEILPSKSADHAAGFLRRLLKKVPFRITTILTDNGKEFTDRFSSAGERTPTGAHTFDKTCQAADIEHRLIQPLHP